jgi:hypothetical protein
MSKKFISIQYYLLPEMIILLPEMQCLFKFSLLFNVFIVFMKVPLNLVFLTDEPEHSIGIFEEPFFTYSTQFTSSYPSYVGIWFFGS